jgi:archaellum biogenesis ATPase FlaH
MAKLTSEQQEAFLQKLRSPPQGNADAVSVSFDDVNNFGDRSSLREMVVNVAKYNKMLGERITLINDSLSATIPFTRENLYLFCAYTGSGKSTVAANISYPLWKQQKKVLVLSNEESKQDVLFRVACLELGLNFNDYKKGRMPVDDQKRCISLFEEIAKYVKVLDVTYKDGLTTKIEGVQNALLAVKKSDYSCVLIDYYQLIKYSALDKNKKAYEVLNDLRVWLGLYIKDSNVPVVLFAQLYSQSKRQAKGNDIDTRIKDCSAIVEPATVIVEVIPNFQDKSTDFIIHKDRFGMQGNKITCPFEKGRYLKQLDERSMAERKLDQLTEKLDIGAASPALKIQADQG